MDARDYEHNLKSYFSTLTPQKCFHFLGQFFVLTEKGIRVYKTAARFFLVVIATEPAVKALFV